MPLTHIHDHLLKLQDSLNRMTKRGIPIDLPYVRKFEAQLLEDQMALFPYKEITHGKRGQPLKKVKIEWEGSINPRSQKAVKDWCKDYGLTLEAFNPDGLKRVLQQHRAKTHVSYPATHKIVERQLEKLIEYKALGKGINNWFNVETINYHDASDDDSAYLAPEWAAYGGSMGRPVSKAPNVQNIPKRGNLAAIRKAFVPHPGHMYLKADYAQGEFRMIAYIGGHDPMDMGEDAFTWLVENTDSLFYEVASETPVEYLKKPRNGAKQMTHALDYGEGMILVPERALGSTKIQDQINAGVLVLYENWVYHNKFVVGFNGSNLATRMFGRASWDNRRKALSAQTKLMRLFPAIERAQRKIMGQAENGYTLTPSGRLLKLYGDDRDNIKKALAMNGQCTLSDYMQEAFIEYSGRKYPPYMFIHDELGFMVPLDWSMYECEQYVKDMGQKSRLIPGFQCPVEAEWGPTYGELVEFKEIRANPDLNPF